MDVCEDIVWLDEVVRRLNASVSDGSSAEWIMRAVPSSLNLRECMVLRGILLAFVLKGQIGFEPADSPLKHARALAIGESSASITSAFLAAIEASRSLEAADGDTRVRHALNTLRLRYREDVFTLGVVARDIGLSPSRLTTIIKLHTGRSFQSHLHHYRVRHAARLLVETDLRIKEISASVGYTETGQLIRHFTKAHGVTPSRFRRSHLAARAQSDHTNASSTQRNV